ncbi:MAG: T9SS type A sorting domain-containing protein, partial [Chitinophagaceae bacterium]|nr:T9SS type A sorting domain-containing protein [Chitinophagaceae bacterium]
TNNTTSIGLAASGSGNIPSFNAINTGTAPVVATVTVTPSFTNAGVTCVGTPGTFTITVNPIPSVNTVASQVLCNGFSTAAVNFTGNVAGTTFSWTNSVPGIGLSASGTGNIASFKAINTGNSPVIATITVTPIANGCSGTPVSFTIRVNPTPTITLSTSIPPLLVPGRLLNITATTNPSGGSFVWFRNNVVVQNQAGPVLPNIDIDALGTYRTQYTDPNGCVSVSSDVVVAADKTEKLFIYPNPNRGIFQVRLYEESTQEITVNVYDSKGSRVYQKKTITTGPFTQILVNLGQGARGTYLVEVLKQNGQRAGTKPVLVTFF